MLIRHDTTGILYFPDPTPEPNCLQILDSADVGQNTSPETPHRRYSRSKIKHETITSYKETLENVESDLPLHMALRRFGNILPKYNRETGAQDLPSSSLGRTEGWIDLPLVCFHTFHSLHKVAIEIEWTDSLASHLEFDRGAKILKLFRFPSFCFLMCQHPDKSLMSK
jgi:hypothetical protein